MTLTRAETLTRTPQFPDELVTYGGNGSVFSNWAQYHLTMQYLSEMTNEQTLTMYSGHPQAHHIHQHSSIILLGLTPLSQGLFPSHPDAPRVVVTNGMMIPNYSTREMYEKLFAMGVTQYGQMTAGPDATPHCTAILSLIVIAIVIVSCCSTRGVDAQSAGSYCYIGPQGIVHGTTITVLNASRKYLGKEDMTGASLSSSSSSSSSPSGVVYVTAGLGGMSGAQPKAATISGAIAVIAEVDEAALRKRHEQGWLHKVTNEVQDCLQVTT